MPPPSVEKDLCNVFCSSNSWDQGLGAGRSWHHLFSFIHPCWLLRHLDSLPPLPINQKFFFLQFTSSVVFLYPPKPRFPYRLFLKKPTGAIFFSGTRSSFTLTRSFFSFLRASFDRFSLDPRDLRLFGGLTKPPLALPFCKGKCRMMGGTVPMPANLYLFLVCFNPMIRNFESLRNSRRFDVKEVGN